MEDEEYVLVYKVIGVEPTRFVPNSNYDFLSEEGEKYIPYRYCRGEKNFELKAKDLGTLEKLAQDWLSKHLEVYELEARVWWFDKFHLDPNTRKLKVFYQVDLEPIAYYHRPCVIR